MNYNICDILQINSVLFSVEQNSVTLRINRWLQNINTWNTAGLAGLAQCIMILMCIYVVIQLTPLFQMRSILLVHLLFLSFSAENVLSKLNVVILATEQGADSAWTNCRS